MGLFKQAGRLLILTDKFITLEGFADWLAGDGSDLILKIIKEKNFKLFARRRAKRYLLVELTNKINADIALKTALKNFTERFPKIVFIAIISKFTGIPEQGFYPRITYAIPCYLVCEIGIAALKNEFAKAATLISLYGGEKEVDSFLSLFGMQLCRELIKLIEKNKPIVLEKDSMIAVGVDKDIDIGRPEKRSGIFYIHVIKGALFTWDNEERNRSQENIERFRIFLGTASKEQIEDFFGSLELK